MVTEQMSERTLSYQRKLQCSPALRVNSIATWVLSAQHSQRSDYDDPLGFFCTFCLLHASDVFLLDLHLLLLSNLPVFKEKWCENISDKEVSSWKKRNIMLFALC